MAEAVMLAVKTLDLHAPVAPSAGYVDAGTPTDASYDTLGSLCLGVSQHADRTQQRPQTRTGEGRGSIAFPAVSPPH